MLASVTGTENTEITQNNTKLTVSVSGDTTGVQWFYTENGVDFSQKGVYLEYENGVLKELTDGWFLLKIGSTQVNVSSDQAIEFARSAVKGFTWKAEDGTSLEDVQGVLEMASLSPLPAGTSF